ncbi:YihY/virulence factor BrkB family protein [Pseudonocardia humida]|uniref:YihY/virulence factor BrkB family protein n=1 Tax=Pseudonocardia humida TaxID=2800819 RepID=A0ABT1ABZ7_9PSEU|nr:YhjD/YihY/BrkB family envelope integrity protein [Pseudonocardia humida]MCO1660470.1 YihY/virulence factor BrkB family protein [Pseudonocardia humida]
MTSDDPPPRPVHRPSALRRVAARALGRAWDKDIFSHSAQAAFWQALSLPPLLLALLGSLGFVDDWFGPQTLEAVRGAIVGFSASVFTPEVVDEIIAPTADSILTIGRADVVSVGFVVALWAGSSAVASIVDSVTDAHGQKLVRHPVWQRIFSLLLYLVALVVAVFTLPVIALGPELLPGVLPEARRPTAVTLLNNLYYPASGLLLVIVLTTLYRLALPHTLPWRRLLPGALVAMVVFIASTTGLRIYIAVLLSTGYTYGALATPIAFLLFGFLLGLSIVFGAHLNNAVDEEWPSRPTRRRRRSERMRSMRRIAAARAAVVSGMVTERSEGAPLPPIDATDHAGPTGAPGAPRGTPTSSPDVDGAAPHRAADEPAGVAADRSVGSRPDAPEA